MPGPRCVVTGGAGFIGSATVRLLIQEGWVVRVLDDMSSGNPANLEGVGRTGALDVLIGDVRDYETCRTACQGVDYVFHLAAVPGVAASVREPERTFSVNVAGTHTLLLAARSAGVKRVVFASSCSVYGRAAPNPDTALGEDSACRPSSPYAASKLAAEAYCHAYWRAYGLETVVLRYFNVYGPRQDPSSEYAAVVPSFVSRALAGLPPIVHGDGTQSRDFVYVSDVARANLLAAVAGAGGRPEGVAGGVFNVGSGRAVTIMELARLTLGLTGPTGPTTAGESGANGMIRFGPARDGDVRFSRADTSRAKALLGYTASVPIEEGLRMTIDWWRRRREG